MVRMPLIRVATLDELPAGALLQREAAGKPVVLCEHAGAIHAFYGLCPHHGAPLGHGNLVDGRIVCPWHAWEFRVEDGAFDYNDQIRLRRYRVEVHDGTVLVEIP